METVLTKNNSVTVLSESSVFDSLNRSKWLIRIIHLGFGLHWSLGLYVSCYRSSSSVGMNSILVWFLVVKLTIEDHRCNWMAWKSLSSVYCLKKVGRFSPFAHLQTIFFCKIEYFSMNFQWTCVKQLILSYTHNFLNISGTYHFC